jgi:diacylglycerol kinase family enzyme
VEVVDDIEYLAKNAEKSLRDGDLRAVVAAGGDGTAALVANHVPPEAPLALLPLGTENLLSKYLDVSADPQCVCDVIDRGITVQLDAGRADGRIFLLMVGCGFDAEVVRRMHAARTGHIHQLSYAKPLIDALRRYPYPTLRIRCDGPGADGSDLDVKASWAFVVNLPRYAMGLNFAPDAIGTDGLLDVCTFRHGTLWRGLWYLSHVFFGSHRSLGGCTTARARRVRIEAETEVPYQLDGDPGGLLPVDIQVLPRRVNMLVPASWARRRHVSQDVAS